ncbi:Small glutamine-rich tetratricopeptide repeat-containing protein 2 [Naganishia albida]|nr:Small glutamine-rich tetratricopeptide repeat-containing protein 2 [Naganishia albida]
MAQVDKKKQLVFNIITFLRASESNNSVPEDSLESLQVAQQCLADAFGLDPDSVEDEGKYAVDGGLEGVWEKFLDSQTSGKPAQREPKPEPTPSSSSSTKPPSAQDKTRAESLKAEGNALISQKQYSTAIEKYSEAIALDPSNAVYYSNRAAAWSAMGEHGEAVKDAERAVERDAGFVRGYSRLGHAQYSLGNYQDAIKAYNKGLSLDPANANMKQALAQATAKAKETGSNADESDEDDVAPRAGTGAGAAPGGMPDMSALAGLMGNMGGGGGGMPDLAGLMSNPAIMQMAQSMMANGGLDRLMSNPAMRNMAERMSSGGGMPDMEALRNDPEMRNL